MKRRGLPAMTIEPSSQNRSGSLWSWDSCGWRHRCRITDLSEPRHPEEPDVRSTSPVLWELGEGNLSRLPDQPWVGRRQVFRGDGKECHFSHGTPERRELSPGPTSRALATVTIS